jgi:hypothetical protein
MSGQSSARLGYPRADVPWPTYHESHANFEPWPP